MLNKHDLRYKNFLKLERQYHEVSTKLFSLPRIKLEEPYQKGWYIVYDLRADIKKRKDASIILEAIAEGFSIVYTKEVGDVRAIRAGKNSIKGKKGKTIILDPSTKPISEQRYKKLNPDIMKYFVLDDTNDLYKKFGHKIYKISIPKFWKVLKVKPNMITHIPRKGGHLESEYTKIKDMLYEFWREQCNYHKSFPVSKGRTQVRSAIQKFKNGETDDIESIKIPLEYKY